MSDPDRSRRIDEPEVAQARLAYLASAVKEAFANVQIALGLPASVENYAMLEIARADYLRVGQAHGRALQEQRASAVVARSMGVEHRADILERKQALASIGKTLWLPPTVESLIKR